MSYRSYIHPKTEKSTMEKKFDNLLNEKCTWSYKTQRVRSNKITKEDDSTLHLESTVMTIEISENTLDKEINNKTPEKNLNNMENKIWLRDEQKKLNRTKNYKKKSTRNGENNAYSPLKKMFNDTRVKTLPKKTMLTKRLPSQKLLSNSDRVLRKSSLKPKDETTVSSSSSDEEVLQARNPAYDKVIYEENNSDSCNMSDKEIVSDEEILKSRDITKRTSPIIIQATPYINQNDADSTNQNCEGKQSSESDKGSKSQLEKDKFLSHMSKKTESTSIDSLSVQPNTPSSEREIIKINNCGKSNANVKDKSFHNNGNKKHSVKHLSENIADNVSFTQNLEEFETPPDKSLITDFLSGSFDVSTYEVKDRYFDYDPMENSRVTNLNTKVLGKNYQFQSKTASPEIFTNDIYEMNIFKERELNHSSRKSTKYKQNELVRNSSIESLVFPTQKRKIIKKKQTKNVNKKRKIQCSEDDSESEDKLLRKTDMRISKVKNAPKETFIECINLDSTGDEGHVYRHTRNSSLLASKRIKEIGKVESISVINDSDIYSVHDESSLSDNLKKNLDEITKRYLKNNMQNENKDVLERNRKTPQNSLVDKDKKRNARNKNKFQVSKEFEEDSNLLTKNRNNSRNKELISNLSLSNDQHSSKDQQLVSRSKNKYRTNTKLKTCNGKQMRKNTDKSNKIEELRNSNISDDEENYFSQRQKWSARNKIKLQENKAKADNNDHLFRENKNKKSNINISDNGSARNQKYLTRSKYKKKLKADNDDYQLKKNENKNKKNKELMSNMILFEEDKSHKSFYKNQYLESWKNRGKLENKKKELSTIHIENEAIENTGMLNKDILPKYTKDTKSITKGKQKTWEDLENELFKDLNDEMTLNDARNVSKTIIVRQEKLVRKKDVSNNTKLLTVSNKSMTQRISKSLKGGSYMQYEVQNTESEYLESRATDTNPNGKEIIPANSENVSVLQKAIAAMDKCTAEFMKCKEVNIDESRWMKNNFMLKENSSLSNDNDALLEENEPCTSTKIIPYTRNLRRSNKCINYKNTTKVTNYHKMTKKDDLNSDAECSVNISHKNSVVNNAKKNKQNVENRSLVPFQEDNPWEGLIKKLDLEQTSKNVSNMLFEDEKCERKEICKMVLNSYNSSNGSQAKIIGDIDNFEKGIDNELLDPESLNRSTEDTTSVKEDIPNNKINLLTGTEILKNDSNNTLAHNIESEMSKTTIEDTKSNRNDSKNILTPSKVKTALFKGKLSPTLKFQVKKDGSLKLKKHSSKSWSESSSSEYSIKLKDATKGMRITQNVSNKTNKSREKYTNYLKKLYKMDSVVERDQTVALNVETIEQPTMVTSEENRCLIADGTKNQLQKSKLIAQKDDDVFSVSSSESDGSKKDASHGSGILCEFFDE